VPESIKNILLVMSASGYLAPPDQKPEQRALWDQTWRHLDRFLPNLRKELFPESVLKPGTGVKSPTSPVPQQAGKQTNIIVPGGASGNAEAANGEKVSSGDVKTNGNGQSA
jgi:hypothetical protein